MFIKKKNRIDVKSWKKGCVTMQPRQIINLIILFKMTDDDDVYNKPNLHPEDQDKLEIPEGKLIN